MDVHEIQMDPKAAQKAFEEYRAAAMQGPREQGAAAKREWRATDKALRDAYKALAEGKTLISLREAIITAGVDELYRPKLAIARADEQRIQYVRDENDGSFQFSPDRWHARAADRVFAFPAGTLPLVPDDAEEARRQLWWVWEASLPFIPPQYRPKHGLANYHLLWEATWARARTGQYRDPILLRRLGGDLFAVVTAWDLSEIEKLVLAR
jgi:hypothetical protein